MSDNVIVQHRDIAENPITLEYMFTAGLERGFIRICFGSGERKKLIGRRLDICKYIEFAQIRVLHRSKVAFTLNVDRIEPGLGKMI
ncbi:hypothetical protein AV929_19915 [Haloarcula sp. K1]|nr:hypothetical protein AV929_19915 [Haloarcula sp. K1]